MEISKLGEFGLIDHLTKDLVIHNTSTIKGVGDDCAVIGNFLQSPSQGVGGADGQCGVKREDGDKLMLVTTDMLMEGIHFDLTYISMQHLGYKSAMVNISDIFAMNGTPRQLTVSIALSKRFTVEDLEQFYTGLRLACDRWNVDIVGGDTTSSLTGLAISITCIGEVSHENIAYRSGARDTDLLCVSGDLGAAYMGLQLLEREKAVYYQQLNELNAKIKASRADGTYEQKKAYFEHQRELFSDFQPEFAGKEYLLQRQLKPEARGDIVELLRTANIRPTSMMDISDGLSSEILHICKQSNAGCRLYEKNIPIDYQTAVMADELNLNVTTCALSGGEDYELLFTVPIGDYERVQELKDVKVIGHITKPDLGVMLITRDGQELPITAQGWNPLK